MIYCTTKSELRGQRARTFILTREIITKLSFATKVSPIFQVGFIHIFIRVLRTAQFVLSLVAVKLNGIVESRIILPGLKNPSCLFIKQIALH